MKVTSHIKPLPLRSLYSITELARAAGVDRRQLQRLFAQTSVQLLPAGKRLLVPLSEIEAKLLPLWESLQAAERLRRSVDA